jgi:aldehyde dehydrogenase (NAD+)
MKEEIFGPLLPVIRFDDLREAVKRIRRYERPLSFYVFGKKSAVTDSLFNELSFGGGSLNDTVMYFANRNLPLGGVGASGIGSFHGEYGFKTFSHDKAIMDKGTWIEFWFLKMPPYTKWKLKILRWFIEHRERVHNSQQGNASIHRNQTYGGWAVKKVNHTFFVSFV